MWLFESTVAWMPTTAFILRRATVVAGEIDLVENSRGQNVGVHLEPDFQRGGRIHGLLDDLVQAKLVGPELLVAEGLEAEHPLALCNELG
jgi:hypothetical protein